MKKPLDDLRPHHLCFAPDAACFFHRSETPAAKLYCVFTTGHSSLLVCSSLSSLLFLVTPMFPFACTKAACAPALVLRFPENGTKGRQMRQILLYVRSRPHRDVGYAPRCGARGGPYVRTHCSRMSANNYALMKSSHLESLAEAADGLIARPA